MSELLDNVNPGDLITADFINSILDCLTDLDERLSTLESQESSNRVNISGFDPPDEIAVGQVLTVFGSNFSFPSVNNTVTIDGVAVTEFRAISTNVQLRFVVPEELQPSPAGSNVIIIINNSEVPNESDEAPYRILAASDETPDITSVMRDTGSENLRIGEIAVIGGENFADAAADNTITFTVGTGANTVVYPREGDQPLDIVSASPTEVRLIVPEIDEVPVIGPFNVTLRVEVGGLFDEETVSVVR